MTNLLSLSSEQLKLAAGLKDQITALEKKLSSILGDSSAKAAAPKKFKMSAAARAKIAKAQRARWAKINGKSAVKPALKTKKRVMSAAAKAKLSAIAKARWAKIKATGKKTL